MCTPAILPALGSLTGSSALATGLSVGGGLLGAIGQNQAIKAAQRADVEATQRQQLQIQQQQTAREVDVNREARKEAARRRVASGEAGLGGLTTDRLLRDVGFQAGLDTARSRQTAEQRVSEAQGGLEGRTSQRSSQIISPLEMGLTAATQLQGLKLGRKGASNASKGNKKGKRPTGRS